MTTATATLPERSRLTLAEIVADGRVMASASCARSCAGHSAYIGLMVRDP